VGATSEEQGCRWGIGRGVVATSNAVAGRLSIGTGNVVDRTIPAPHPLPPLERHDLPTPNP
jgi:hypothetical protein